MPRQCRAAAAGQQPEPVGQPAGDLGERQRPQPGGGELDRQRQAVKPPDDVDDQRAGLAVQRELRADRRRPVGEQPHGGILVKGRDDEQRLPGDAKRLPACRHDPQPGAVGEQCVRQVGARVDEMLAVVQDQQGAGVGQPLKQPGACVAAGGPLCPVGQQARFPQADRAEYRLRHVGGVGDRREFGEPDPVRRVIDCAVPYHCGDLGGQPRLARTAGADQGDETAGLQRLSHPGDLVRAADEAGELRPQVRAGAAGGRGGHGNFAAQHVQVDGPHVGSRVDAELVGEPGPQRLVPGERVRLPSGSGQRPHQQPGELLVQRVFRDQRLKLADAGGGPARVELLREEGDRRVQPQLLKAAGERLGEVPGIRERRPAPQRQRLGHGPLGDEPLKAQRVHVAGRHRQPVPRTRLLHGRRPAQCPAGPRHQSLQRVRHIGGERAVPDGPGQRAGAHRLAARQRQPGDQAAQPRAGDSHRRPAVVMDLKWPQYRDLHSTYCACGGDPQPPASRLRLP